jgi:hypothetical protein
MKFDARQPHSPEEKEAFVAWLRGETISTFQRSAGDAEGLKAAAFLVANRAREAGLVDSEVGEIVGVAIARSRLDQKEEEFVLDCVDAFDPLATAVYLADRASKPWWRFWR